MKKKLLVVLIMGSLMVGCGTAQKTESISSASTAELESSAMNESSREESVDNDSDGNKEANMERIGFGTVKEINDGNVEIDGIDSKVYTGDTSGIKDGYKAAFEKIKEGDYVFFVYTSREETEDGYKVNYKSIEFEDKKLLPNDR
ncbi:MAG: hypothetical protein VZR06_04535 [Butyrivibrio sp.]|nr:hypothetical protein [Butyrivibrio sp.]